MSRRKGRRNSFNWNHHDSLRDRSHLSAFPHSKSEYANYPICEIGLEVLWAGNKGSIIANFLPGTFQIWYEPSREEQGLSGFLFFRVVKTPVMILYLPSLSSSCGSNLLVKKKKKKKPWSRYNSTTWSQPDPTNGLLMVCKHTHQRMRSGLVWRNRRNTCCLAHLMFLLVNEWLKNAKQNFVSRKVQVIAHL